MPCRATLSHTAEQVSRFGHTVLFMVTAMDAPLLGTAHPQTGGRQKAARSDRASNWTTPAAMCECNLLRTGVLCERCPQPP